MIECLKNDRGDIIAVCEWLLFNKEGQLDDEGNVILIAELEVNKSHRFNGTIRYFIKKISEKCPTAEKMFFFREFKYPGRKHKVYSREQILRRIKWVEGQQEK